MTPAFAFLLITLPAPPKVVVVPIQSILRSAPDASAVRLTELLVRELAHEDAALVYVAQPVSPGPTADRDGLARLEELAVAAENSRNIEAAIGYRREILDSVSSSHSPGDFELVRGAHHELARVLMLAGLDTEADQVAREAAAYGPPDLPTDRFSRLYRNLYGRAPEEGVGALRVSAKASGLKVAIDGRSFDQSAPLCVLGLAYGKHFVEVGPRSFAVDVRSGLRSELALPEDTDVAVLVDDIRRNKWTDAAVHAARALAARFGVSRLVAGGLSDHKGELILSTLLIEGDSVGTGSFSFDRDLLTADSEIMRAVAVIRSGQTVFRSGPIAPWLPERELVVTIDLTPKTSAAPRPFDVRRPFGDAGPTPKDEHPPESDRIEEGGSFVTQER
ncbi:MAG: hypothetical protein HY791_17915 [Deltaproteobacteria bacterium]|nr:hypothetical protein [Deltaproteobacteria bacterium]